MSSPVSRTPRLILAGDIGGTKASLALFTIEGERLVHRRGAKYHSSQYPGLNAILREFLKSAEGTPVAAGFGVPGPVHGGKAKPTNLSWGVDAQAISEEFSIPHVGLLNDLAANAYGISHLEDSDFATLQKGSPTASGNRCVVSPGTGLGEAGLYWDGRKHRVWACEGGHSDFAPRSELEVSLLEYLIRRYGHVSMERVVSGMGIENIYAFLRDTGRARESREVAREIKETGSAGAVISKWAEGGKCAMCTQTLEIFVNCLGAEAGNMALKAMATGGVYLGGGIPAKMLPRLRGTNFLHAFNGKGRLTGLMETMPVRIILNDDAALMGAAQYGMDLAE